jgi:hypothetical protein
MPLNGKNCAAAVNKIEQAFADPGVAAEKPDRLFLLALAHNARPWELLWLPKAQ